MTADGLETSTPLGAPLEGGARPRILLVENDGDHVAALTEVLAPRYELRNVASPQDAIAACQHEHFDLVLVDVDGPDLLHRLRADPRARDLVIVVLSSRESEDVQLSGADAGADDYIVKPCSARELRVRIAVNIRRAQQRRRAIADLRESEERFRSLADHAPALIWMSDENGQVIFTNRYHETVFGAERAHDPAGRSDWRDILHPDDLDHFLARFDEAFTARRPLSLKARIIDKDGQVRWVQCDAVPRVDNLDGRFRGYVGCSIDVTDAHLAAEDLERRVTERTEALTSEIVERERMQATLSQMQRLEAVGQLTSGVAHDFNNLLTVVLGNLQFLERSVEPGSPEAIRLGYMRSAAERGAALTAQLLAFARRQHLTPKPADLNGVVGGMRELLQSTLGGSVKIETSLKPGLWRALVDTTQLELVILNLAINARDAMPVGGTLKVSTDNVRLGQPERAEEPPAGDYVMIAVSDTGSGMEPHVLARVFEPFFTTKEIGKGSGLGLAQVLGFAAQSHGGVRIDSRPGEGTTVRVYLPRSDAALETGETIRSFAPRAEAQGRCVLVVDDDDAVREIICSMLKDLGFSAYEAESGPRALEQLEERPDIDLVLLDFAMPGMNGADVARHVQRIRPGMPTLFITGFADTNALSTVGETRIIQKPFQEEELVTRVRDALDGSDDAFQPSLL